MDKKQQQKAAAEPRRQDVSVNKPWPRSSKKREAANNGPSKDVARKQSAPRGKSFDKRPKPRGSQYEGPLGGKTGAGLENDGAEVGSLFLPGSKKHNLNHLLNFHYAPRDGSRQSSGRGNRKPHGLVYTNTHKHNKELFLQSNCQFVVKANGDYAPYLVDPDLPICWEIIEQINVRVNEPLSCPICLGETVAGRITKCGHTYCWPCLLHYFALSESSNRPCPICFQPIDKINLKSVQGIWQHYIPVGDNIHMKLMRRLRGSTAVEVAPPILAVPIDETGRRRLLSVTDKDSSSLFSKLLTASPDEVYGIITRERQELNDQLSPELEHPQFILEALHLLELRENDLKNTNFIPVVNQEPEHSTCSSEPDLFVFDNHEDFNPNMESEPKHLTSDQVEIKDSNSAVEKMNPITDKYFYFYQSADGQAIFLHGLNNRIIEATWGSLSMAPRDLHGNILERASGSVGLESRRRVRCLQHLPIHCPYDLVEIQLEPPLVTHEALKIFRSDLEERKRQRQRRARDEKRREKVITHQERIIMGHVPELELNINSEEHFPVYQPDLELSPPVTDWKWEKDSIDSSPGPSSLTQSESHGGPSFAKMASTTGIWKVRQTPIVVATPAPTRIRTESDCSDSELGAPPAYNVSLGDAITEALLNTSLNNTEERAVTKDGKKKKKFKPKVLFTTGIQHRTAND